MDAKLYAGQLKKEIDDTPFWGRHLGNYYTAQGYKEALTESIPIARAYGMSSLWTKHKPFVYKNDLILGSLHGLFSDEISKAELDAYNRYVNSYGDRYFSINSDHFAPDYDKLVNYGIGGIVDSIDQSIKKHGGDVKKITFLHSCKITMEGFSGMIKNYARTAAEKGKSELSNICDEIEHDPPTSFHAALQLVCFAHLAFVMNNKYAMAFGRLDQYLYPFYKKDIESGTLTKESATRLLCCAFLKIYEFRAAMGYDDVVNIAIGGVKRDGTDATNDLSYCILNAVKICNVPGPNLSARIHNETTDEFLNECLKVIGTGLGYPALMNDDINIAALQKQGYSLEDSRDYCMVGCIENFIQGKMPPWTDGRFNVPKYLEYALNSGKCMLTDVRYGSTTEAPSTFDTFDKLLDAFKAELTFGAAEYRAFVNNDYMRYNNENFVNPFMSCLCNDCIERGLDINNGGAIYPAVHGACCMGIGTVADSLAAIEKVVYLDKVITAEELSKILKADFVGYEDVHSLLLKAPKYGNDDDFVDKYAIWYVDFISTLFMGYHTDNGGIFNIGIASNIANIPAGLECAASPDGRKSKAPMSDAASPMYGRDVNGPTAVVNSISKADYTKVGVGTVLNQKLSPVIFQTEENIKRLAALIRVYFKHGGQEMQINAVDREVLIDAMQNPDKYRDLVVRVSGFSAYFISLNADIQNDILNRTEQC